MKSLAQLDDRAKIMRRLGQVRPDSVRRWGKMSAPQMICHLADACRMAIGEKPVSSISTPLPAGIVKWIALYSPLPWPRGVLTRPEIDQLHGGTCPGDFSADLSEAVRLLELVATQDSSGWPVHPIFGTMSARDWLRWGYVHTDHHLRQFGL
jgi:hypothetical protein